MTEQFDTAREWAALEEASRDLPFVISTESGVLFWVPPERLEELANVDADEVLLGEGYAIAALRKCKEVGNELLLAMILRDMTARGRFGMIEAGFLCRIAGAARAGAMN